MRKRRRRVGVGELSSFQEESIDCNQKNVISISFFGNGFSFPLKGASYDRHNVRLIGHGPPFI